MSATCRGRRCGAPILWAVTTGGKLMPLDPDPSAEGSVVMTGATRPSKVGAAPEVRVLGAQGALELGETETRYMPHHATCPDAGTFRQ